MCSVRSSGESGKCMITSWAERTSTRPLSDTPLGIPVVPEGYSRVVSSQPVVGGATGGARPRRRNPGPVEGRDPPPAAARHALRRQSGGQPPGVLPQLCVGPAPLRGRVVQGVARGKAMAVALDPRQVGEVVLEHLAKGAGVITVGGRRAHARAP